MAKTLAKTKRKGKWTPPRWTKSIPKGGHGSTDMQKRYWKLMSDYIRIKEWYDYGTCVSCNRRLDAWNEGQAAHWKSWGSSNSWGKFNMDNIALSCANCNRLDDGEIGHNFGEELKRRLGENILEEIRAFDNSQRGKKMEEHEICLKMENLVKKFDELDEQPEYYSRVIGNMV